MRHLIAWIILLIGCSSASAEAPQIRLTLQQGVPVTTADIAAATSVCLEPYLAPHNQLSVFDGTNWVAIDVAPSTYCLSTSGLTANANYDVLVTASGGLPVLSWSPAYANDTTPPARALQNGVEVQAADHTKLVIGAVHVNSIGQLEDSHTHRWLSNYYNPQPREMWVVDPTPTWTYSISTGFEQAHANAANQLDYIVVVPRPIWAQDQAVVISSGGAAVAIGIGIDSFLGNSAQFCQHASVPASLASNSFQTSCVYVGTPGIGRHTVLWIERGFASGTTQTWLGYIPPLQASGIMGVVSN